MCKDERTEARLTGLTTLEVEMERIFGENGLRKLISDKIEYCAGLIKRDEISEFTVERHNNLVEYLGILDERKEMPF